MSLCHSYVIPYTADSNFDEIAVYDALEGYLGVEHLTEFYIRIARNRAPLIYTSKPLSPEMVRKVEKLVNRAAKASTSRR